ncbi:ceramide synthase 1-like [Saccoglossus kowalevskii]|uniref:Ceramide synthase 1-like n=1 Tax=Saccoglossus kowalevskii TaxID=10224 RepID=A0ABM0MS22_SACKO|nr:PREDICTED: ceramide synthase 1-like [Saccoglossus kowalevskii]
MGDSRLNTSAIASRESVFLAMPGYYEMVTSVVPAQWSTLSRLPTEFDYFGQFTTYCHFTWVDVGLVLLFAVFWTVLRATLTCYLYKPFLQGLKLDDEECFAKAPESFFKSTWYTLSWIYTTSILFSERHTMFQDPASVFGDWSNGMEVPLDIYILYVYQCGFYVHSIYATIYVDAIKSDFYLMIAHHILTINLLVFSYAVRYYKIGVLVIFCHDICDVFLENARIFVQTKERNGQVHNLNEMFANLFFAGFVISWFLARLYWYPLKVLYAAGRFFFPVAPFVTTFNVMLWLLLVMNIYWFWILLQTLIRLVSGELNKGITDTREKDGAVGTQQIEKEKNKKKNQ